MLAKIKQLWLQYFLQPTNSQKLILSIGVTLLYIVSFMIFYPHQGVSITAFTILPVTLMAWYYGWQVGIVMGLASFVLNTLLLNMVGHSGLDVIFETGVSANFISGIFIAIGIGKIGDTYTENQQTLATLTQQHNLLTTIVDYVPIEVFAKDRKSRFIFANSLTRKSLRATRHEDYIGKTDFDFMGHKSDEAQQYFDIEQTIMQTGEPSLDYEFSRPDTDGNLGWGLSSKMPYYDSSGEIIGIVGINSDITKRKQIEEGLRQSEASLLIALEAAKMRTWHWDLMNNRVAVKGVSLPGFERSNYESSYPDFLKGVHEEDRATLEKSFNDVIQKGVPYNVEYRVISAEGKTHWITSKGDVEQDETGTPIAINGISFDITDHKQAEQQRLELALERERMQLLASFITQASHEFRTPLSIISTSTYILQHSDHRDKQEKHFHQINQQVNIITQLIENLSTLSKLDSGQNILLETIDFNQMLHDMFRSKEGMLQKSGIEGTLTLDETPILIYSNIDYLEQAFSHLWDNAVRYTPRGKRISMRSQLIHNKVIIEITDTGIGISSDDLPYIFSRFYRADKAGSTRGFGLGLPIAKAIIEHFGGQIDVTSVLDQGSVFRVTLPVIQSLETQS